MILMMSAELVQTDDGGTYTMDWSRMTIPASSFLRLNIEQFFKTAYPLNFNGNFAYSYNFSLLKDEIGGISEPQQATINLFEFFDNDMYSTYLKFKQGQLTVDQTKALRESLCPEDSRRRRKLDPQTLSIVIKQDIKLGDFKNSDKKMVFDNSELCTADPTVKSLNLPFGVDVLISLTDMDNQYLTVFYRRAI